MRRILVGAAASEGSAAVLVAAAQLATTYGAELIVLDVEPVVDARHVFDPEGAPDGPSGVAQIARRFPGLQVRGQRIRGNPVRRVCEIASQEKADIIVLPHGRRRGGGLSMKASSAVVEMAPCPVMLIAS